MKTDKASLMELLWNNDGYSSQSYYCSKDMKGEYRYMVFGGKLFINFNGVHLTDDKEIFETREATDEETLHFVMNHMIYLEKTEEPKQPDFSRLIRKGAIRSLER